MSQPATRPASVPLCVDLDGTLVRTDLVWETFVRAVKRQPWCLLLAPLWLLKGRAHLKAQLAARVTVDLSTLPYNQALLAFLRTEKESGRAVYLVTASNLAIAQKIAAHLGLFSGVMASDNATNLKGPDKAKALVERFGAGAFDYAGDASADITVWEHARAAIVVEASGGVLSKARQHGNVAQVFAKHRNLSRSAIKSLRPHQWMKNLIVFVPLITSHNVFNLPLVTHAVLAFVAYCLCSSGVYVINDLLDLEADRRHARKRLRPFAAGDLPLAAGLLIAPALIGASLLLSLVLPPGFIVTLGIYVLLTTSYSWYFRQVELVDVFCLAGLYTIRLISGHEATQVVYSFWLLAFSIFIFLSLALVKRFVELASAGEQPQQNPLSASGGEGPGERWLEENVSGRGYLPDDDQIVAMLGVCSGFISALVLALYVHSEEVRILYSRPMLLLLIPPLLLYWISRVWLLAHRQKVHSDPIVFALRDGPSYLVGILTLAVLWLAKG
jgi:4-hydroxybenzoate polyprenyltransferase/phosphoserine phosphatase